MTAGGGAGDSDGTRTMTSARAILALTAALAVSACSSSGGLGGLKSVAKDEKATTEVAAATPNSVADGVRVGFCPKVQLITNEETFRTYEGRDRSIENIRYQASLYDVTRTCRVDGDKLMIDVAAAGRLLAGPKGDRGGSLKMPIRIAVKDSNGVPYSELETHSAAIDGGRTSDQFIYKRNTITIPATADRRTVVLVGFDEGPQG